ncbi:MAG: hypothetical protein JW902_19375 [Syntrophaceae bacterium]|nr:hypothetical protein [Syntrophaceae bacterium]
MQGIICYYSGTGNTKAVCECLVKRIPGVAWTWHDIVRQGTPELQAYDIAGFATFTDFWSVPKKFKDFMESLKS